MGKVKRLRKKYRALCSNSKNAADNQAGNVKNDDGNQLENSVSKAVKIKSEKNDKNNQINALYDMIIDTKGNRSSDLEVRSNYSISKSIKSNLSGQSILKKDKQRLKHELFLKKLESSAEFMNQLKKNKRKNRKIDLKDDLPLLSVNVGKPQKSSGFVPKNLKTSMKNPNSGKGLTKRRNARMIKDIEQFQKLLKKDSTSENQFEVIQRRIVDRLSKESVESMNIS